MTHPIRATAALLTVIAVLGLAAGARAQAGAAEVLAANQAASGSFPAQAGALRTVYAFDGMGLHGQYISLDDLRDGRFVDALTAGPLNQVQGYDGDHAWLKDPSGSVTRQDGGEQRQSAVTEAYQQANLWWRQDRGGANVASRGVERDGDAAFDVLTVTPVSGKTFNAWFDGKTHLLARTVNARGDRSVTTFYLDYRPVEGVMLAHKVVIDSGAGAKFLQTLTLTEARFLPRQDPNRFAAPTAASADFSIDHGASETAFPFRLIDNHIYADVSVDGKGPFLFIVDTGAENTITPATAKRLGVKVDGTFVENGAGTAVAEAGYAKVPELGVAAAHIRDQIFEVSPSASEVEGFDQQGILGFAAFRRFVTRIDYGRKTVTLIDPKRFDPKDAGVPIHFDFEGNAVVVTGSFEGVPGRFIVDTGSRGEIVLTKPFVDRNGFRAKHPTGVDAVVGWGVGGAVNAYAVRGATFAMGPVVLHDVVTLLTTQEKGAFAGSDFEGDIGGGVLKRFVATFDYGNQTLYLKPLPTPVSDTGTFDRAGMWFNAMGTSFRVVDVTRGGPAEAAGLRAGDEITAIDAKPAKAVTVYDLRRRLRTMTAGSVVTFKVLRHGRSVTRRVVLRDLI